MSKEKSNRTLKIFALIISVVLWIYVMDEVNPEIDEYHRNINVTFENEEKLNREGLLAMEPNEVTISVKVTGKRSDMTDFKPESIKASLDLSGYGEGQKKVPVNVKLNELSNVKITNYEPKEVLFTFDRVVEEEKEVKVETNGKLESGYILGQVEAKTKSIILKGPRSWINKVSEVIATVELNGRKETGIAKTSIRLFDEDGNEIEGIDKNPREIEVMVPILRTTKVPIELKVEKNLSANYEITEIIISPSEVEIKGNEEILEIVSINTKPVDISNLKGDTEILVELDLPEGVEVIDSQNEISVLIKITESMEKTFSYKLEEVEIQNLDENLLIQENEYSKDLSVTLKGSKETIEKMNKENLNLYMDFDNLVEGVNELYINFDVPEGTTVKEIDPQPVEILLIKSEID